MREVKNVSYENANQVVWLSRCSFPREQRPVPPRAASVDRRNPVRNRVPDLVRRIFLDEMDSRHCLLGQCRPPAYKVDQPVACENGSRLRLQEQLLHIAASQPVRVVSSDRTDVGGLALDRNFTGPRQRWPSALARLGERPSILRHLLVGELPQDG